MQSVVHRVVKWKLAARQSYSGCDWEDQSCLRCGLESLNVKASSPGQEAFGPVLARPKVEEEQPPPLPVGGGGV